MSFVFAVGLDGAAMHFYEVAHYREAQARSAVLARARPVSLAEALEDEWQGISLDPLPRVADGYLRVRLPARRGGLASSTRSA